ncbi:hypothetical protein [Streptomyces sp. G45]|uniref:hypothetical protein n=1 Tax=Streptomyces sp. G45 TaxID=3406627 RepID=UPI003C1C058B
MVDLFTALAFEQDRMWLGGRDGLYYSDDFGATAVKLLEGEVTAILLDGGNRMILGGKKIQYSVSGGPFRDAWTGGAPLLVRSLLRSGASLYAGTSRGVLRSTDDGASWLDFSSETSDLDVVSLSSDRESLYVGTKQCGVYELALPSDG